MGQPAHDIRCPTDPTQPQPVGFCDRCNSKNYLGDLQWQFIWAGPAEANIRLLVCRECWDVPNEQHRVIVIGPDPVPLKDPRPGFTQTEENAAGVPPIPPYVLDEDNT